MSKKCYVWILKQRNVNKSYDNHNYNNCKGNRNNNTNRKQARLSVVMTLRFIHDYAQQGESMFWKWLGMRSCRPPTCCVVLLSELEVRDKPRITTRRSRQMEWQEFCLENQRESSHKLVPADAVNSSTWSKEACVHLRAFDSVSLSCLHLQKSQHR